MYWVMISAYIIGHRFVSKVGSYIREEKCWIDVVGTYPLRFARPPNLEGQFVTTDICALAYCPSESGGRGA